MSLFKKLVLASLLFPLFFLLLSFLPHQKVNAVNVPITIRATSFNDLDGDAIWDKGNQNSAGTEACLSPISVQSVHSGKTTTKDTTCSGNGEIKFETNDSSIISVIKTPGSSKYTITGMWLKDDDHRNGTSIKNVTALSVKGNANVYFGIKEKPKPEYSIVLKSFIDSNKNGRFDSGEACRASAKFSIKNVTTGVTKDTFLSRCPPSTAAIYTSTDEQSRVSVTPPDGFLVTGFDVTENNIRKDPILNQSSVVVRRTATVNVGLKAKDNNNPPPDNKKDCTNTPGVTIKPSQQVGKKGSSQDYTVTVFNRDKKDCDANNKFGIKVDIPNNWKKDLVKNELQVNGQDNKSTKLTIKSPQNGVKAGDIQKFTVSVQRKSGGKTVQTFARYKIAEDSGGGGGGGGGDDILPSNTPPPDNNGECERKINLGVTANKEWAKPGGQIVYTVKVKNEDQGKCDKRNLNLQRLLPNDKWKGTWDPKNEFDLAKGVEKTFKLTVKSPENVSIGTKKIKINLRSKDNKVIETKEVDFVVANVEPTPTEPIDEIIAQLNITIGADGLGTTKRIPLGGNKNPEPDFTNLDVLLYNTTYNISALSVNTTFNYDPEKEKLVGSVGIPFGFKNGDYNLYITGPRYKVSQLPGSFTFSGADKTIENANFYLIAGDINKVAESNNNIDINDYNVMLSCSIYSQDTTACDQDPNYIDYSDLNYDGLVNEDDFTLWLKEVANQEGAPLPTPVDEEEQPQPAEEE